MSDALFTRIAESLEKLVHHFTSNAAPAPSVDKPAKAAKAPKEPAAPAATAQPTQAATQADSVQPAATATAASGELLTQTAETIIDLANNYSRDSAVAILTKFKAQKVSQLKAEDLPAVLAQAQAAIAAAKASKATESLV